MAVSKLFNGNEPSIGMITDWTEIPMLEMAAMAGVHYIVLDNEHRAASPEGMERVLATAQGCDVPTLIRVPEFEINSIGRVLDQGFDGIIIPHIEQAADLDEVMKYVYFPPRGERGIGQARGNNYVIPMTTAEYVDYVNMEDFIVAQIESPLGVKNAEEIASHPGVAAVMVGPRDLSTELGKPGDFFDDEVQGMISEVNEACRKYGKKLIMPCGTAAFERYQNKGINNFLVSAGPAFFGAIRNAVKLATE
ncbi:MAG: aldolase/citrate lyase family protein [Lachnospiraceae bacterium]|nr:aldolase/citrate lyase family protein [Lachnospiraceae bacterium]